MSETVSGNMGMPKAGTKWSGVFGKIPDLDRDRGVWSGPDRVPIGLGPNFPNTTCASQSSLLPGGAVLGSQSCELWHVHLTHQALHLTTNDVPLCIKPCLEFMDVCFTEFKFGREDVIAA